MRIKILLCLLLPVIIGHAQNAKPKFTSLLQVGLVDGQRGPSATVQTINGIQYGPWSAGAGVALDYYHSRSVPLFLDIRRNILKADKTPFVYLSGGYNFPWLTEEQKQYSFGESEGGLYYDAGIGYSVPVLKKSSLFFTTGYSAKKMTTSSGGEPVAIWSSFIPPSYQVDHTFRRISLKMGLRF